MVATEFADGWLQGLREPDEQLRTAWVDHDFARKIFYADCDEATVAQPLIIFGPSRVTRGQCLAR